MATLPIVNLDVFFSGNAEARQREATNTAEALIQYGALIVKDSRVSEDDNAIFLDMLEDYFAQSDETLQLDTRPEFGYQGKLGNIKAVAMSYQTKNVVSVGATLENTEKPRCTLDTDCHRLIASLDPAERPLDLSGGHKDPKSRFFWRMDATGRAANKPAIPEACQVSEHPEAKFAVLKAPNVVPRDFKGIWQQRMDRWGSQMLRAVEDVNKMLATGLGLEQDSLTDLAKNGSHLLAPTATNLTRFGEKDHIFAGFHSDLNYLTIHGRSRYPGLHIWARNAGKKIAVSMPPGHLLVQAGKQLEHLTGNLVAAGFHEVVCTDATLDAMERQRQNNPSRPLIRISSTFFYHLSAEEQIEPMPELEKRRDLVLRTEDAAREAAGITRQAYPKMYVGELVQRELQHISLMA